MPAHPNWQASFAHWPHDELERIEGYAGVEIYNGLIENPPGRRSPPIGGTVRVDTAAAEGIRLVSDHGLVQQAVDGPAATFRVPDQLVHRSDHSYVRVECPRGGGAAAWLQPMFLA